MIAALAERFVAALELAAKSLHTIASRGSETPWGTAGAKPAAAVVAATPVAASSAPATPAATPAAETPVQAKRGPGRPPKASLVDVAEGETEEQAKVRAASAQAAKVSKAASKDELMAVMNDFHKREGTPAVKEILAKYKVAKLSELPEAHYAEVIAIATAKAVPAAPVEQKPDNDWMS